MKAWEPATAIALMLVLVPAAGALQYEGVGQDLGVAVQQAGEVHPNETEDDDGATPWPAFPEVMGGGVCFADVTGNGYDDLYVVKQRYNPENPATDGWIDDVDPHNRLFENTGSGFTEITENSRAGSSAWGYGCSAGDYDGDGDVDLFVANFGANELFENTGNGTFVNATAEAGVDGKNQCGEHRCASVSSAWADYDGDGDLDLYVGNYVDTDLQDQARGPQHTDSQQNFFYENQGDGTFVERGVEANVVGPITDSRFGSKTLGVSWFDHDNDGLLDLFVANDESVNDLYVNDGDGTFTEKSVDARIEDTRASMGLTIQDYDQDGWQDLFFTHYAEEHNGFYHNTPNDVEYEDRSGEDELAHDQPRVGWGTRFVDADRDGDLDLLAANGHTEYDYDYNQPTQLFTQAPDPDTPNRNREWTDNSSEAGLAEVEDRVSRGAAFADYDYDGDTDVAMMPNANQSLQLLEASDVDNEALTIRLAQPGGNPHAIGARVTVETGSIETTQALRAGSSYLAQNSLALNFGLGQAEFADRVTVEWPDGSTTALADVRAGEVIRVEKATDSYVRDTIPPVSSIAVDGDTVRGWYPEPVTVEISASDRGTTVTTGVETIRTAIDDEDWAATSTREVGAGVHRVHASAVDGNSNTEPRQTRLIGVDPDPPGHLDHEMVGETGEEGWFTSDAVGVRLQASDALSGLDRIEYRIDDGPWTVYNGSLILEDDGVRQVDYRAFDKAGNPSPIEHVTVRKDAQAPNVTLVKPGPGDVYLDDQLVADLPAGPAHVIATSAPGLFQVVAEGVDVVSGLDEMQLRINEAAYGENRSATPAAWTVDAGNHPPGVYDFEIVGEDRAGNERVVQRAVNLAAATPGALAAAADGGPSLATDPDRGR
jgi:hypothetical protein